MNEYKNSMTAKQQNENFDANLFLTVLGSTQCVNEKKLQPIVVK